MRHSIRSKVRWFIAAGVFGMFALISPSQTGRDAGEAQKRKPVFITRLYTGPDGQTHAEEIEAKFSGANDAFRLMALTGGELHRAPAGRVSDWHNAPRRQYIITLSGRGELEVAGGKKIPVGPGHIELVEDTTGKGHITRVVGSEDRVTVQLPLSDQGERR